MIVVFVVCCLVAKSCLNSNSMNCSPGNPSPESVCGISQARILEWVAIFSSRGSSRPRDWTVSPAWQAILYDWATREVRRIFYHPPKFPETHFQSILNSTTAHVRNLFSFLLTQSLHHGFIHLTYTYVIHPRIYCDNFCSNGQLSFKAIEIRRRRLQPTRLLCPWDFPGKNTRVGWHFLLQLHSNKK